MSHTVKNICNHFSNLPKTILCICDSKLRYTVQGQTRNLNSQNM